LVAVLAVVLDAVFAGADFLGVFTALSVPFTAVLPFFELSTTLH
jgi:hypothetical protein